ncbi:MAG: putative sulfate exporter family transporter [Flavobacteriales bacterium]|nr:putative sulfate exporter family transporter [Flavobacteriales bacterium]
MILKFVKPKLVGVFAATAIACLAVLAGQFIPLFGSILLALVFGMVAGNTFLCGGNLKEGLKFSEKTLLEISIVFLGFGLDADSLRQLDLRLIVFLFFSIIFVIGITVGFGKMVGLSTRLSLLLGAGSAICGSAAIGATAPIIGAKDEEVGVSVGVVNLLGLIGIILLPNVSVLLRFTDFQSSVLLGGTLQAIGHVAASGFSINEHVGEWAMVVKMSRVIFLIPLLIVLFFVGRLPGRTAKFKFPVFIFFFAGTVYLNQLGLFSTELSKTLASVGNIIMAVAMAAIGLSIQIKPLLRISPKAMTLGAIVFVVQIAMFCGFCLTLNF